MAPDKLSVVNDRRVEHRDVQVRGKTYHYLLAKPATGPHKATILLVHGFPDLAMGWRYQVPLLLSLGLQVVVPDMLGYGRTDAPDAVEPYSMKSVSDDLAALLDADFPSEPPVLVGGHDWGGQVAWRFAEWHPHRVAAVFSVCTPYFPPRDTFADLPQVVQYLPSFTYQLQFAGEDVVRFVEEGGRDAVRGVLNAMYGGVAPDGKGGFSVEHGIALDRLDSLQPNRLLAPDEMDFYVDEFARHGFRGPTNWYRTRKVNFDEELQLARKAPYKITAPALFVSATRDVALPPAMSAGMDKHFENLTRAEVDASHWALAQAADEVNKIVGDFLTKQLKARASI